MDKPKVHKFEQQASQLPSLKVNPRPSAKPQTSRKESPMPGADSLPEDEQKSLVLKLIDFLETF